MKIINKILILVLVVSVAGCGGVSKNVKKALSENTAPIISSDKLEIITAGLNSLEDRRPKQEVGYMTSVSEKVSAKLLNILKDAHLFDEVHSPANASDNIMVRGYINKFNWRAVDTMISYIPGLNMLPFLGLPSTKVHSEVDIDLDIVNNETKEVIFTINQIRIKDKKFNIYNFETYKAEQELADCFDSVLAEIVKKVTDKKGDIIESLELRRRKKQEAAKQEAALAAKAVPATVATPEASAPAPVAAVDTTATPVSIDNSPKNSVQ